MIADTFDIRWVAPASQGMQRHLAYLSVSDVERLAKAGVQIAFKEIAEQILPDEPRDHTMAPRTLMDAFWERWRRSNRDSEQTQTFAGTLAPFGAYATEHAAKVYLLFCPTSEPPFLIEDERSLFPSDALMASIHLWMKTHGQAI